MISLINSTNNTLIKLFDSFSGITDHDTKIIQDYYDSIIYEIDLSSIQCKCGCNHWNIHSYYGRTLSLYEHEYILMITRIQCMNCKCTHALLPAFITPHLQLSSDDIIEVISSFDSHSNHSYRVKTILRVFKGFYIPSIEFSLFIDFNFTKFFSLVKRHRSLIFLTT